MTTPEDLQTALSTDLRGLVLDRLDAGDFTVADVAAAMMLPADIATQLVKSPSWGLDLCLTLCARFDIHPRVVADADVPDEEPLGEPLPSVGPAAEGQEPQPVETVATAATTSVPKPGPPKSNTLYAVPPLEKSGGMQPRERVWLEPGEVNPRTNKRFVKVDPHALQRADEMGIDKQRVIEALQDEHVVLTRPGNKGDRKVIESSLEPLLLFVVQAPSYYEVITILWKTDEPYVRNPSSPPPTPKTALGRV